MTLEEVLDYLAASSDEDGGRDQVAVRRAVIAEYCDWLGPIESDRPREWRMLAVAGGLEIGFYKPGKDWKKFPHDMTPTLRSGGRDLLFRPSFENLFASLRALASTRVGRESLEILGNLMVRNARMADHARTARGTEYSPTGTLIRALRDRTPLIGALDPIVFLCVCEAIAVNEDVRYQTWKVGSGHEPGTMKPKMSPAGRPNTLLTLAHFIAALLGRATWSELLGDFTQQPVGVAPLDPDEAAEAFVPASMDLDRNALERRAALKDGIRHLLESHLGVTVSELVSTAGSEVNSGNKAAHTHALRVLMKAHLGDMARDIAFDLRDEGLIYVKTIRLKRDLTAAEGIPLNAVSRDVRASDSWASSRLCRAVSRPWAVIAFARDNQGIERLAVVRMIRFQAKDIRDFRRVWEQARVREYQGDKNFSSLTLSSRPAGATCYVNTKSTTGTSADGRPTTPRSFWISGHRMAELMWSSSSG